MFEQIKQRIAREVDGFVSELFSVTTKQVKKQVLAFLLKSVFLIIAVIFISVGIVLLGGKFVGYDLMLLLIGVLLLLVFLLLK